MAFSGSASGSLSVNGIPVPRWRPGADYEDAQGCTTKVTRSRLHHLSAGDLGRRGSRLASGRRGSRLASGRRGSRLASVGRLASVRRRGHCASGIGRGLHRRTNGRRGSGPRPSCHPTPDPTTGRGTSNKPGTARVEPGRRQRPPNPRTLNRRSLRPLMLRHVRCFSCRKHSPLQCERILLGGEVSKDLLGRASSGACGAWVFFCSRPRVERSIEARCPAARANLRVCATSR
jgi:hypothetical protein